MRHASHPSLETLALLLEGAIENDRMRGEIVPHLAAHCPVCREALCELERAKRKVGHWSERVAIFESREAAALWERLEPLPFPEQLHAIAEDESFQIWGLCSLLLHRSLVLVVSNPPACELAQKAARLALAVGTRLDTAYGPESLADLRALCLAALANAHRVLGEIQAAADTFSEARMVLERGGTGDPRVAAELAVLEAALAYEQRQFSSALALYEEALALCASVSGPSDLDDRERRLPLEALAGKAAVLREAGQLHQAISLLRDTLARNGPDGWSSRGPDSEPQHIPNGELTGELEGVPGPALRALLQRDLLLSLVSAGCFAEAEALLMELSSQVSERDRDHLRLRACAGLIASGLERSEDAENILREVIEGLLDLRLGYDAAIVTLELATLYADQERQEDLVRLAQSTTALFESPAIHREAMAAIITFQHACEREKLTVQLARHLARFLWRERPHTLFSPPPAGFPGQAEPLDPWGRSTNRVPPAEGPVEE